MTLHDAEVLLEELENLFVGHDERILDRISELKNFVVDSLTWIPVSEGLPKNGQEDIAFVTKEGRKLGGKYINELQGFSTPGVCGHDATHWIPLPPMTEDKR